MSKKRKELTQKSSRINMKVPSMFRDEPAKQVLNKAKKISDLKNLGPETEKSFENAGIKTAQQFIKLGWKKAMIKLVNSNPKHRHSILAYALIGALTNIEWNAISEKEKLEAREFVKGLKKFK